MSKHQHSTTTSSSPLSSTQQAPGSSDEYVRLEEQWAEILTRFVIVERDVAFPDFEEMKFEERSIRIVMDTVAQLEIRVCIIFITP
ncbi:hypothetical protein CJ030_MR8G004983 [Morella rubra]|uniref:Uncharacterized protein n=1 Tax=Morella rubra TaxID=262757 RepID=A0A6A1UQH9_9ROSI|nr:hypothetical protein CJ030_MR8G004983 [Morella rubra]